MGYLFFWVESKLKISHFKTQTFLLCAHKHKIYENFTFLLEQSFINNRHSVNTGWDSSGCHSAQKGAELSFFSQFQFAKAANSLGPFLLFNCINFCTISPSPFHFCSLFFSSLSSCPDIYLPVCLSFLTLTFIPCSFFPPLPFQPFFFVPLHSLIFLFWGLQSLFLFVSQDLSTPVSCD